MPERLLGHPWLEDTFPRVVGYRFDVPADRLAATFDATHRVVLTTQDIPTSTLDAPIVDEKAEITFEQARELRPQTVAFLLATHLQQHDFTDRPWLFPQLLDIVRAIIAASGGAKRLRAEVPAADFRGTTAGVSFDTIKDCWTTDPGKCHFNLVPQDSDWETIVCMRLEKLEEVRA
jgi:type III restriction enzyme